MIEVCFEQPQWDISTVYYHSMQYVLQRWSTSLRAFVTYKINTSKNISKYNHVG